MSDKPKPNKCKIHFHCSFSVKESCVHFKPLRKGYHVCKYEGDYQSCTNVIAQVNALTVLRKKIVGEVNESVCPECMKEMHCCFQINKPPYYACECGYKGES